VLCASMKLFFFFSFSFCNSGFCGYLFICINSVFFFSFLSIYNGAFLDGWETKSTLNSLSLVATLVGTPTRLMEYCEMR